MSDLLTVPARFCGPARSGNGGWTAGALAELTGLGGAMTVSLRQPPPLDASMLVVEQDGVWTATFGGIVIGRAEACPDSLTEVDPIDATEAREAMSTYPGLDFHPFPTCVVCGTGRDEGDGLRIFPGEVPTAPGAGTRVASTWTPDPSVEAADGVTSVPVTWGALDCIGAWASDLTDRLMVLARMSARLDALPVVGEEHVVVGEFRRAEGRKSFSAATLYDSDGRVVATAEHLWIAVDPADFN